MTHDFDTSNHTASSKIVYVRPVAVRDLPEDVQAQVDGMSELFAVHSDTGERLALVTDRKMAFVLARQNEMSPVHVH